MLPPPKTKVICKSSIIPEASSVPNGSIEEEKKNNKKLKSLGKCPNTAPIKKKFSTSESLTKVPF